MPADNLAEGEVEHVRGGVVGRDGAAPVVVDMQADLVTYAELAAPGTADVKDVAAKGLDGVNGKGGGGGIGGPGALVNRDLALVGQLAAHFGVEVGLVQDDSDHAHGLAAGGVVKVFTVPDGVDRRDDFAGVELV